jgi:hypothetical protein
MIYPFIDRELQNVTARWLRRLDDVDLDSVSLAQFGQARLLKVVKSFCISQCLHAFALALGIEHLGAP